VVAALGVLALAAGGAAGVYAAQRTAPDVSVSDASGAVSVSVPRAWDTTLSSKTWKPPGQDARFPAVSAGSGDGWTDPQEEGEGVFVGLLPGDGLPASVPGHPECPGDGSRTDDIRDGDPLMTVVWTGCPGVVVERVVRVTPTRLLWVQVRSDSQAEAYRVLDSVETHGI
jgi:hypothetical protein